MKRLLIGLLVRLLDSSAKIDYKQIDKKAVEDWAFKSFDDRGWRSYFAYEDMKILKELSFGKEQNQYFILVGRRLQLLYLFDEMKRSYENKKSAEEKKQSAAQPDIAQTP
ncbi:MAG: hypothetical protein NUV80_04620 [Candidatus Berkelbacteria bacterium]|nr:hypothetical protein [Candidatus Berkelbacteria bacterium]